MLVGMKHNLYADFWNFIAEYLPDYYSRGDVLRSDILFRFLDNDELWESDLAKIQQEFGCDKEQVAQELAKLGASLAKEALENYFWEIRHGESESQTQRTPSVNDGSIASLVLMLDHKKNPAFFNANQESTTVIYKIVGRDFSKMKIKEINQLKTRTTLKDRISRINKLGAKIVFSHVEIQALDFNLQKVDTCFPQILGALFLERFSGKENSLSELVKRIGKNNPLEFPDLPKNFYSHKIKRFLLDVVLGLTPNENCDCDALKMKMYLVAQKDREKLNYIFLYSDEFSSYLLKNLILESPCIKKHRFGEIETDNSGNLIFKLNLQIRFK